MSRESSITAAIYLKERFNINADYLNIPKEVMYFSLSVLMIHFGPSLRAEVACPELSGQSRCLSTFASPGCSSLLSKLSADTILAVCPGLRGSSMSKASHEWSIKRLIGSTRELLEIWGTPCPISMSCQGPPIGSRAPVSAYRPVKITHLWLKLLLVQCRRGHQLKHVSCNRGCSLWPNCLSRYNQKQFIANLSGKDS